MKKYILVVVLISSIGLTNAQTNDGVTTGAGAVTNTATSTVTGDGNNAAVNSGGVQTSIGNITGGSGGNSNAIGGSGGLGGSSSLTNSGNNVGGAGGSATGGAGGNAAGGSLTNSGNSTIGNTTASGGNVGNTKSSSNNSNNSTSNVNVEGSTNNYEAPRIPVATAYAPSIAPTAVCALSLSGGAQSTVFGFSMGGSYIDKNCEMLEQVRAANAIGANAIAIEMMMALPAFAEAVQRINDRKNIIEIVSTDDIINHQYIVTPVKPQYIDPIIRNRLGLPPL